MWIGYIHTSRHYFVFVPTASICVKVKTHIDGTYSSTPFPNGQIERLFVGRILSIVCHYHHSKSSKTCVVNRHRTSDSCTAAHIWILHKIATLCIYNNLLLLQFVNNYDFGNFITIYRGLGHPCNIPISSSQYNTLSPRIQDNKTARTHTLLNLPTAIQIIVALKLEINEYPFDGWRHLCGWEKAVCLCENKMLCWGR